MPDLEGSVHIDAPVAHVFSFVDDWRNTPRYLRGLAKWEPSDPARAQGLGARFVTAMKAGPVTIGGEMEVVEHVPPERIVFRSIKGPRVHGSWTFRAERGGTRVVFSNLFDLPGGVAGRVVAGVVRAQGQRDLEASLADLKRLIEDGG